MASQNVNDPLPEQFHWTSLSSAHQGNQSPAARGLHMGDWLGGFWESRAAVRGVWRGLWRRLSVVPTSPGATTLGAGSFFAGQIAFPAEHRFTLQVG
jgi:hypothetical protein